jgi:hypothetical protein
MKPLVPLVVAACVSIHGVPVCAEGPLARSVTRQATQLAAGAAPPSSPGRTAGSIDLRWAELAPVVVGQEVTVRLLDGSAMGGEVLVVREDALVVSRPSHARGDASSGANAIVQRSNLHTITLRKITGGRRHLGTVLGVLNGVVIGGYVSGNVADSAGTGIPLFLAIASAITVAGYYTGRQLDTRVTVIRVVP